MKKCKLIFIILTFIYASNVWALQTVSQIDLKRYLGKWHEIARFDSWFEKNCVEVTAEYSLDNEIINVLNSCRIGSPDGLLKQVHGRAKVVPNSNNTKLKVSFLPKYLSIFDFLFSGDYWILKIDSDYQTVLVGDPSKKYLWILARKRRISTKTYNEYVEHARSLGFDVTKLQKQE